MAAAPPKLIDSSYVPRMSIQKVSANTPIQQILKVIESDGGVILTDLVSTTQLANIEADLEAHVKSAPSTENSALHIIPKETLAIPGLVGKSQTVAEICELTVLDQLREAILEEKFSVIREEIVEENSIASLLSLSITLNIGYNAPRQRLHRDDNVHGIKHGGVFDLKKQSQFGCLIAGTRTTRENGATLFVPGSHKWDDLRVPSVDEVCFAGMTCSQSVPGIAY